MGIYKIRIEKFGDEYALINWPQKIDPEISEDLLQFDHLINQKFEDWFIESNTTYASLCIRYDPAKISFNDLEKTLKVTYQSFNSLAKRDSNLWEIPVCYHPEVAEDSIIFCKQKNIDLAQLIKWHSEVIYRVYFLGFLPGFLYLGGMDKRLELPRRSTPRQSVPKGAVGIAGNQTGIYPQVSPGGWNLIGRSPIELFDAENPSPCFIQPGDQVKFKPIDLRTFSEIITSVYNNNFSPYKLKT